MDGALTCRDCSRLTSPLEAEERTFRRNFCACGGSLYIEVGAGEHVRTLWWPEPEARAELRSQEQDRIQAILNPTDPASCALLRCISPALTVSPPGAVPGVVIDRAFFQPLIGLRADRIEVHCTFDELAGANLVRWIGAFVRPRLASPTGRVSIIIHPEPV